MKENNTKWLAKCRRGCEALEYGKRYEVKKLDEFNYIIELNGFKYRFTDEYFKDLILATPLSRAIYM